MVGRWIDAGELELGDDVWQADGSTGDVESMVVVPDQQWMYNLTVEMAHTFFVGQQGWLVHNCGSRVMSDGTEVRGKFPRTSEDEILYRKDNSGDITHYQVYDSNGLPIKRVDITGKFHGGVETPHVVEFQYNVAPDGTIHARPNRDVHPARIDELP